MPEIEKPILILGGTAEASELASRLSKQDRFPLIFSLAGRTRHPGLPNAEIHMGGFGGAEGLELFLLQNNIVLVVDATHPFATEISENAFRAAKLADVARVALVRPPWQAEADDRWWAVETLADAVAALPADAHVFLAVGSQHVTRFAERGDVHFTLRMIDPPGPLPFDDCKLILGRPGKTADEEERLFREQGITHLVCRNSGGSAGYAKIEAARRLGLPVIIIDRPPPPEPPRLASVDEVLAFVDAAYRSL